ncbi:SGNH/GDSL hydrolase family protein [Tahibacter amnicola]|uniref:SGNH/GDSL hydrolase family protein n=1 Tax=Tahibacter amnicola TaxID=2976241 RepID=A0ABY6BH27_9GAMM|nr:SGNH/GDSL hydrolase family protein [Tahibacter amnicola]UXI69150.1 SGNH/GDSL hydrolase family protein [Tahibacter amnicola]
MWPEWLLGAVLATQGVSTGVSELRFLALGDSYTIGEGVSAPERWPHQLAAQLRANGVPLSDPTIVATTGWTTDELSAAMDKAALSPPYDLVTLSIGVNNQYRGYPVDQYRTEFAALLDRAIMLAGHRPERVVVVSIPDWGVTTFGAGSGRDTATIARELDTFNTVNREEARKRRVAWADVAPASRRAGNSPDQLASDGLHPSGRQYTGWVREIYPPALAALSSH